MPNLPKRLTAEFPVLSQPSALPGGVWRISAQLFTSHRSRVTSHAFSLAANGQRLRRDGVLDCGDAGVLRQQILTVLDD
jgi:hypothetical protein